MNVQISFAWFLAAFVISLHGDGEIARKHYGLSFHSKCIDYVQSFTCMTTCKSIGFTVFRMDFRCKCSCHALKTTTILPFFKWRTNGTTKTLPRTQSPSLYHIAGTISPPTVETTTTEVVITAPPITCEPLQKDKNEENSTNVDDLSNTTEVTTSTYDSTPGNNEENSTKTGDATTANANDSPDSPTEPGAELTTIPAA
ncbi:hypothetical protein PYW07_001079 [Mythimna separata]|uniref:Uncharacterized protein n=1 Tax=Mythimna separata TaxID=271217 RepID=A0AAD7YUH9_MYTSE|nr:hypothetical protein PYW07_001079 [Mythimna separata]